MTSLCRGLGLKMIPNLSKSYRAAPECIISTAQHARPNVIGHMEPLRAQLTRSSTCGQWKVWHAAASNDVPLWVLCRHMNTICGCSVARVVTALPQVRHMTLMRLLYYWQQCVLTLVITNSAAPGLAPIAGTGAAVAMLDRWMGSCSSAVAGCVASTPDDRCTAFMVGLARAARPLTACCDMMFYASNTTLAWYAQP